MVLIVPCVLLQDALPDDPDMMNDLLAAAQAVRDTLNDLLQKVRDGGRGGQQTGQYDDTCDSILGATDRLFKSMGNAGEMVKQAKILALVSTARAWVSGRACLGD